MEFLFGIHVQANDNAGWVYVLQKNNHSLNRFNKNKYESYSHQLHIM